MDWTLPPEYTKPKIKFSLIGKNRILKDYYLQGNENVNSYHQNSILTYSYSTNREEIRQKREGGQAEEGQQQKNVIVFFR